MKNNNQKDIGCNGLIDGYAKKQSDNTPINIREVSKEDGELYCAECLSKVNFRRCTDKIDHFYHVARQSNMDFTPESKLHLACKNELLSALQSIHPEGNWEAERHISSINSIPDLSGRINNKPLAIEIQKSSIKPNDIIKRTEKYASIGISVLWIVPLYEPLGEESFRPRMIEKFFHEMYDGKCFYWDETNPKSIYPVHYSKAFRYIEQSEFYSEDGEFQSFGGYDKAYKTIKTPNYGRIIDITEEFSTSKIENKRYFDTETMLPKALLYENTSNIWWDIDDDTIKDERLQEYLEYLSSKKVTFGKYKHTSVANLLSDESYCQWFANNAELVNKYETISEAIRLKVLLKKHNEKKEK